MKALEKVRNMRDRAEADLLRATNGGQGHRLSDVEWTKLFERRDTLTQVLIALLEEG